MKYVALSFRFSSLPNCKRTNHVTSGLSKKTRFMGKYKQVSSNLLRNYGRQTHDINSMVIPQKRKLFLDPASQITVNKKPEPSNAESKLENKVPNMNSTSPISLIEQLQTELAELRSQQDADREHFRHALGNKTQAKDLGEDVDGVKCGRAGSSTSVISISSEESETQMIESEASSTDSDMYDA